MKKTLTILFLLLFGLAVTVPSYASDWDKAGIALTGIEGLRIISGGKIDLIGTMFGMGNTQDVSRSLHRRSGRNHHRRYKMTKRYNCTERVWAPDYKWKRKFIPKHEEYREEYGKVIVEGHHIKYKVQAGGHWNTIDYCG